MKILIVDDDVVSRMVLMHLIDGALPGGCEVLEAEDGADAWRQLEAGAAPAMLFCDLRMPHLSGMELLARVKADVRYAGLPFVLASAAGDAATMEQALGLGADGYIVKPFDAARVGAQLARLTGADEAPAATARRLGIDLERLRLYLGGLARQLDGAGPALEAQLAAGQPDAVRSALARLGEGCRTLGLAGAAAAIEALQEGAAQEGAAQEGTAPESAAQEGVAQEGAAPDPARLARALADAHAAVLRRLEAAHGPAS